MHLTVRQRDSDEAGAPRWHQLGLSARCADAPTQLASLPEKPEPYPYTDEASLRRLIALLRGAMQRHERPESWS